MDLLDAFRSIVHGFARVGCDDTIANNEWQTMTGLRVQFVHYTIHPIHLLRPDQAEDGLGGAKRYTEAQHQPIPPSPGAFWQ